MFIKYIARCSKQDKLTFSHNAVVNIFIVNEIDLWPYKYIADFTLEHSSFGDVKLTRSSVFDKYEYSEYGIGFDLRGTFLLSHGSGFGKNAITFGADLSSSADIDNKKNKLWFLVKVQHKG